LECVPSQCSSAILFGVNLDELVYLLKINIKVIVHERTKVLNNGRGRINVVASSHVMDVKLRCYGVN
jgi:hypothetical protein